MLLSIPLCASPGSVASQRGVRWEMFIRERKKQQPSQIGKYQEASKYFIREAGKGHFGVVGRSG